MRVVTVFLGVLTSLLILTACGGDGSAPPSVSITSPASGSPVSGTVTVQVSASDDVGVKRVDLYARERGAPGNGVLVGSASQAPFVIAWFSPAQPNRADLELIAVAQDSGGNEASSPPVMVKTQNSGAPTLQLLTAFTLEPDPSVASGAVQVRGLPRSVDVAAVIPPAGAVLDAEPRLITTANSPVADRDYILEWQWEPLTSGADGYGIYLSEVGMVGPYEVQRKQSSSAGVGAQKYSAPIAGAAAGDRFYGVVTALTGGAANESGLSNADGATFLPAQQVSSPEPNASIPNGRPTFSWTNTPGTTGYLYYLFDRNPWEAGAVQLWSNFPQSTKSLSTTYDREPLAAGTYWWWVAGVSFDRNGKADGFTFSEARSFSVP